MLYKKNRELEQRDNRSSSTQQKEWLELWVWVHYRVTGQKKIKMFGYLNIFVYLVRHGDFFFFWTASWKKENEKISLQV